MNHRFARWAGRAVAALAGAALLALVGAELLLHRAPPPPGAAAPLPTPERVARGRVLAIEGNCADCHTRPGGAPYAGGAALETPFGVVYGSNLTPDEATGLGRWSADDFWRALHEGRSRDGRPLVPAFPYTAFTHVTREDSDALWDYLRSLPPVRQPSTPHALRYPYGTRVALAAWQWLNFTPADLARDAQARADMPASQARGAYLVLGLGHCAACHAPHNLLGAPADQPTGGPIPAQAWYAPSLFPEQGRAPAAEEIFTLLRDGQSAHGSVLGPMARVVYRSLQHWPEDDLRAVADHLAALPARPRPPRPARAPEAVMQQGQRLYTDRCADCHGANGEGRVGAYPTLAGNATVLQPTARNLVQVLRFGGFAPSTAAHPRPYGMPPQDLDDAQAAAVLSHVRQSWGNDAAAVTELDVLKLR